MPSPSKGATWTAAALACGVLFAWLQLGNLAHPLLWQDELQTVLYGRQVLRHGYPKLHDGDVNLYDLRLPPRLGVDEERDAYVATPWLQYYFAALGVALAERVDGDYERTRLLRLPFALAGTLGILLFLLPLRRVSGEARSPMTLAYLAAACVSIVLILHAREARYYSLAILELALLFHLHVAHRVRGELSFGHWAAGTSVVLVLVFHTFTPLYVSAAAAIVADAALGPRGSRAARLSRAFVPVLLSGIVVAPALLLYTLVAQRRAWAAATPASLYVEHLVFNVRYLSRHEFAIPALSAAALSGIAWVRTRQHPVDPAPHAASRFLALLVAIHLVITASIPLVFERYLVMLSPAITTLCLLQTLMLVRSLHGRARAVRWRWLAPLALVFAASVAIRAPEVKGRLAEIREPVVGPVDAVIQRIRKLYADPSELVVATNYESGAYLYYLGSRVVVGWGGRKGLPAPGELPDIVVPRRLRELGLPTLKAMVEAGHYVQEVLPVADLPANNLPTLQHPKPRWRHRFRTPLDQTGHPRQVWYRRLSSDEAR